MSYESNVQQARAALATGAKANWKLARLTHESTYDADEVGFGRTLPPEKQSMEKWCEDVRGGGREKFSPGTGFLYKKIWAENGAALGPGEDQLARLPAWEDAEKAARGDRRDELAAWDVRSVMERGTPKSKAELLLKLVGDRDVALEARARAYRALLGDPEVRRAGHDPEVRRIEGVERVLTVSSVVVDLALAMAYYQERVAKAIAEGPPPVGEYEVLKNRLADVRNRLDDIENDVVGWLETGKSGVDRFIDSALKRE